MNVIVQPHSYEAGRWVVTLPEFPTGTVWSIHDGKHAAEIEAQDIAADMGYDGVEVQS